MANILLIEDEEYVRFTLRRVLEEVGHTVFEAVDGEDGMSQFKQMDAALDAVKYDAVILDLGLPDQDGIELLRQLRDSGDETPVLILTARNTVDDRVLGLNSGGDDYVLKPCPMKELVARIHALLRRPSGVLGVVITAGNVSFDTIAREVRINDKTIAISRREMSVLEHLMRCNGHVVPKDVLEEKIYGFDKQVSSNSVEVIVSRLRNRLSKAGSDVGIHTRRGFGYLLSEDTV